MTIIQKTILILTLCTVSFKSFSQETNWQSYIGFGYSISYEDVYRDDPIEEWQGYTSSYQRVDSTDLGHGIYFQYEISNGKWYFPATLGINIWNNNIYGIKNRLGPQGSSFQHYEVYYKDLSLYGQISIGAGYDILHSSNKFDLIPLVQVNPEISFGHKSVVNEYIASSEDVIETGLATDLVDLDTSQFAGLTKIGLALQPSIGMDIRYRLGIKTTLRIGTSYYWKHFSRNTFGNVKRKTHGLNGKIGLLFEL